MARKLPSLVPWRLALRWSNPYRPRPDGFPEVLAEARIMQPEGKGAPREHEWPAEFVAALADERARPGQGYGIFIAHDQAALHETRKAWAPERKAETRVRELRKRVAREAGPLFQGTVDGVVKAEVDARPEYFDPARIPEFEAAERERTKAFLARLRGEGA